jgi:phosphoglycolate phosphatase
MDGALGNSAAEMPAAMAVAFGAGDIKGPARGAVRSITLLSLPEAFAPLRPHLPPERHARPGAACRAAHAGARLRQGVGAGSPLFPGARAARDRRATTPGTRRAVATGRSRRGLRAAIAAQDLGGHVAGPRTAEDPPPRPDPAMIRAAGDVTGLPPGRCAAAGDTTLGMEMARAAGTAAIGAARGYQPAALPGPGVLADVAALPRAVEAALGGAG